MKRFYGIRKNIGRLKEWLMVILDILDYLIDHKELQDDLEPTDNL